MGHLPLPSSSTATVKRRGGLPPDCPPRPAPGRWGRNVPHRPLVFLCPPSSFFLVTSGRTAKRIAGEHRLGVSRPALPPPPWDVLLLQFCSSCRSFSATSSSSSINFFGSFPSSPMREEPVPLAVGGLEAKDTTLAVLTRIARVITRIRVRRRWYKDEGRNRCLLARGRHRRSIRVPMSGFVIRETSEKIGDLHL